MDHNPSVGLFFNFSSAFLSSAPSIEASEFFCGDCEFSFHRGSPVDCCDGGGGCESCCFRRRLGISLLLDFGFDGSGSILDKPKGLRRGLSFRILTFLSLYME